MCPKAALNEEHLFSFRQFNDGAISLKKSGAGISIARLTGTNNLGQSAHSALGWGWQDSEIWAHSDFGL